MSVQGNQLSIKVKEYPGGVMVCPPDIDLDIQGQIPIEVWQIEVDQGTYDNIMANADKLSIIREAGQPSSLQYGGAIIQLS